VKLAYVLGTTAGGTGTHVAMLARECAARGMPVTVYGPARAGRRFFGSPPGGMVVRSAEGGAVDAAPAGQPGTPPPGSAGVAGGSVAFVTLEIADRPRPARDLAAVLRLRGLLRRQAPDVVHAHGLRAGAVAALAVGRRRRAAPPVGGGRRPALAVTVHNAPIRGGAAGAVYPLLEGIVARRADAVTWVSSDLADRMRRRGARDGGRALVPALPADPPSAPHLAAARDDLAGTGGPVVLSVGRLTAQKGFGVLLRAAAGWQARPEVPLLAIAGEGPLGPALATEARARGLAVRFLGQRDDIPALLAAADVVVVPSVWEGQPLIVQEALRAGKPLVASRTGGIPDLTGEDSALLVPPGDPGALTAAIVSLLDDPGRAEKLSAAAIERAASLPTVPDAVGAAVALYERLT
jgi:glycosyltransferase involved in cell wall biosynthesis